MSDPKAIKILQKFSSPLQSIFKTSDAASSGEVLSFYAEYDNRGLVLSERKYTLSGEVEEDHSYLYSEKGHLLEHLLAFPAEEVSERYVTERNEGGYPLVITKYYGDDPGERTFFEYNADNKPVNIRRTDADGEPESEETIIYNDKGLVSERAILSPSEGNRKYIFSYNDKGWLTEEKELNADDKLIARLNLDYDDAGRELVSRKYNEADKLVTRIDSVYDELDRLVKRHSKGFYQRITLISYDEQGRVSEESLSDENGFVISRNRYTYDEEGRLADETIYETDLTRAGRDTHLLNRYQYEFF